MSYNLKTLIVFDTNSLRNTEEGEVAYSFFAFGKPFQIIEEFINENKLEDEINLAVPDWAIEELKDQKNKQYYNDIKEFQKIANRLLGLPNFGKIPLLDTEFNCTEYIESNATEFLKTKNIKRLKLKDEIAKDVLKNMMVRVMKDQGEKAPFAHSGKYKDAGFKDNLVWESLMNFDELKNYDKVIFVCKDGDFNKHCIDEFKRKWQKHIAIEKDENNVLAELKRDYGNYISNREIYVFTEGDYFRDYLDKELTTKSKISIEGNYFPIENYQIIDYCSGVIREMLNEEGVENIVISSKVDIYCSNQGRKKKVTIEAITALYDEESKEILLTEYDNELI